MEIISGVERRRRWRVEEKLRIVAELEQPGACFVEVARRHDVSRGLLWNWRQQARRGTLQAAVEPQFLAVQLIPETSAPRAVDHHETQSRDGRTEADGSVIEIILADGITVRIKGEVGATSLRRVLGALRG